MEGGVKEKDVLMAIQQTPLEKRLERLTEKQRIYLQGYLDGILQAYKPFKLEENEARQKNVEKNKGGADRRR
jgi:hypothetical protein